ncbi:chemotaxis protein CheW [Geomonas nitrogeniifigens]|uniref:Chemotaxis protein CheW n=1 Tax=Geomonas diazotrophica TaxID=2843197 RepID=A0ABX8JSY6_9BACT|nr:chemotaxis protein CheW [Geomonas nitrogeniifigens]
MDTIHLLIFALDGQRYALSLDQVTRVIRAAALTPIPHAPDVVLGILDLQGEVIPVINLRKRFRLPERGIGCEDQFVVAHTGRLQLALHVDGTEGVLQQAAGSPVSADEIVAGTEFLAGVTRTAEGLVLIHDLDTLLFPDEEAQIRAALEKV